VFPPFPRGPKPATRRMADGERMNPPGRGGAFAPIQGDVEHQGDEHLENRPGEGSAPRDRAYGLVRPAVSPPDVLLGRGRIFPAPARGTAPL
jgi:hypothetical protein